MPSVAVEVGEERRRICVVAHHFKVFVFVGYFAVSFPFLFSFLQLIPRVCVCEVCTSLFVSVTLVEIKVNS